MEFEALSIVRGSFFQASSQSSLVGIIFDINFIRFVSVIIFGTLR